MPRNISKIKLKYFSLFSVRGKKFGYGNYNRIKNLILILKDKRRKFFHYSYDEKNKSKSKFLDRLSSELNSNKKIILDITNDLFLDKNTILRLKKILSKKKFNNLYIIDSPTKKNLSTILNLDYVKTLIPFEITNDIKKKNLICRTKNLEWNILYTQTKI